MDIYEVFGKFELELLPQEWVQLVWRNDFSENIELPAEYEMRLENVSIGNLMNTASLYIKDWLSTPENVSAHNSMSNSIEISKPSSSSASESTRMSIEFNNGDKKSWRCLIANQVQHKSLMCLLSYFIQQGRLNVNNEDSRQLCLKAISLYFIILAIPGSVVFHVFHSILYSQAIEGLKMCNLLNADSNVKQKSNRGRRGNQAASSDDEADDSDLEEERQLTAHERNTLIKSLNAVLNDILFSIKRFQLKGQEDSVILTTQILVSITRLEKTSSNVLLNSPTHATITSLAHNAYIALKYLCAPEHGAVKETVRLIMRELLPGILIYEQKGTKLSTKEAIVIKDHSIQFVRNILLTLKEAAFLGVKALVQHLCIRIPDKADIRVKCVQVVLEVMDVLPYTLYSQVVVWIMSLCHSDQVKNRITGLEIITRLLSCNERVPTSPVLTVRQVQQINKDSMKVDDRMDVNKEATLDKGIRKDSSVDNEKNADENENCDNGENTDKDVNTERSMNENNNTDIDTSVHLDNFSSHKFLIGTVFSRTRDTSATVRAKALSIISNLVSSNNRTVHMVMENIFIIPFVGLTPDEVNSVPANGFLDFQQFLTHVLEETNKDVNPLPGALTIIELLEDFAEDEKVFVRKSALQVLCNIFLLNDQWMSNRLLQLLVDNCRDLSVSVRKMLVQCLTELLNHYPTHPDLPKYWIVGVLPLLADQEIKSQEKVLEALQSVMLDNIVAYDRMRTPVHDLPWKLLSLISDLNMRKHLLFGCHKWTLNNCIKQSLITTIQTHIGTENNISAWFLLASIAEYTDIKNPQFVLDYYYENIFNAQQVDGYCSQLVVEVLHLSWRKLPNSTQLDLCKDILKSLTQFIVPLPLIARSIDICLLITEAYADSAEESRERVKDWAGHLIQVAENHLHRLISADSPPKVADEELLSQYIFTIGDASQICPNKVKHETLLLLQNLLEVGGFSDKEENRWKGKVSASVQAVAVITLGKICLQKDRIASTFVPLFGALLSETSYPQIKINAMIALADLCIRFTSMVEKHIPDMCICMRDKELIVRENTLSLMIQLIQEDYLKLRCPVFFHILTMLLDKEQHIRDMVSSFLINSLLVKKKNIMVQHFVESLFHYNGYTDHPTHSKIIQSAKERATFSLEGPGKEKERRTIYCFMLEHMMDDQRLRISHQICTDILVDVTEGTIQLNETGKLLLQDTLYVLSCDEIRLSQMKPSAKDDDDDGGGGEMEEMAAEVFSKLAKKTVSEVIKKNFVENMVPIFIKLKHKLKQLKSVLVKDLMNCLRELLKDYKTEINDILAADKELAAEIQLDMQNSEENASDEESGDEGGSIQEEVLKQAVMEVVVRCKRLTDLDIAEAMNKSHQDIENENIESEVQRVSPENLAPNPSEGTAPFDQASGSEQTTKSKTKQDIFSGALNSSIVSKPKSAKSKESPPGNLQDSITSLKSKDFKSKDSVSTPLTINTFSKSKSSKSKDSPLTSSHEASNSSKSRSTKSRSDTSINLHDSSSSSKSSESRMSVNSTESENSVSPLTSNTSSKSKSKSKASSFASLHETSTSSKSISSKSRSDTSINLHESSTSSKSSESGMSVNSTELEKKRTNKEKLLSSSSSSSQKSERNSRKTGKKKKK